jgi:PTH1 family peptidyl-tRNA hydrolase
MLASSAYNRLKIGIGRPPAFMKPEAFVLANFASEERVVIQKTLGIAVEALKIWIEYGCGEAMNRFN